MEDTAYLVVFVNTSDPNNPKLVRAGIFSASANNLTKLGAEHALDVTYARGETYEKAELALWRIKGAYAGVYDWAFNLLPQCRRASKTGAMITGGSEHDAEVHKFLSERYSTESGKR